MHKTKLFIAALSSSFVLVAAISIMPLAASPEYADASQTVQECPPPTEKGAYFERGHDKEGNIVCGFAYYDECPYAAGYSASDAMCEKIKLEHDMPPNYIDPLELEEQQAHAPDVEVTEVVDGK